MTQRRNKRSLCAVIAGWQGDAVLALLAGPGLSSHHVFTQRLHLVCVSGAHFDQYEGGSIQPGDVFTHPELKALQPTLFIL